MTLRSLFCFASLTFVFAFCFLTFDLASAHEVYVLDEQTIAQALAAESENPFNAYTGNKSQFYFWALVSIIMLSTIFFVSGFHLFEQRSHRILSLLKRLAHPLVRLTVGTTLVVFGWYGVLYGPELPLQDIFGAASGIIQVLLIALGVAVLAGIYVRAAALAAVALYAYAASTEGWHVLNYTTHLGAYFLLFILGSGEWSLVRVRERLPILVRSFIATLHSLAFPFLRLGFGFGVIFAAVYAKFLHSELALQVVYQYELTLYLPFEPLFIVLGALIIEFLAGLMMLLGVAVRWTALFLAFWLTMGHIFTVEMWWVHLVLYGLAVAIFCHGYDRWSLEGRFLRKNGQEPVL